jgi:hypothetical protein
MCTDVVDEDSATHSNAVFFPPTAVASCYSGYVGCMWLMLAHNRDPNAAKTLKAAITSKPNKTKI